MPKLIDLTGQTFERLTALAIAPRRDGDRTRKWRCKCSCGGTTDVVTNDLVSGKTRSCGCLLGAVTAARNFKHGYPRTRGYNAWCNMRNRCDNPANQKFHRYGARGIVVCDRWNDFANFIADMGEPAPDMSLDRKDNDGPYSPENCHWVPQEMQQRNRSDNVHLTARGKTLTITEWERETGAVSRQTMQRRLAKGWSHEDAIFKST